VFFDAFCAKPVGFFAIVSRTEGQSVSGEDIHHDRKHNLPGFSRDTSGFRSIWGWHMPFAVTRGFIPIK